MRKWLAGLLLVAGCASAPVRPADVARLAEADARVLDGCYTCLLDARDAYAAIATTRPSHRRHAAVRNGDSHQAARSGVRPAADAAFARAEALLPELPADTDAAFLLELASAMPGRKLIDAGVAPGDKVVIWSEHRTEWVVALWGRRKLGMSWDEVTEALDAIRTLCPSPRGTWSTARTRWT